MKRDNRVGGGTPGRAEQTLADADQTAANADQQISGADQRAIRS